MDAEQRWYVTAQEYGAERGDFWCWVTEGETARRISGPFEEERSADRVATEQAVRRAGRVQGRAVYRATPEWLAGRLAEQGARASLGAFEIVRPGTAAPA
jgi:hypothetical protein